MAISQSAFDALFSQLFATEGVQSKAAQRRRKSLISTLFEALGLAKQTKANLLGDVKALGLQGRQDIDLSFRQGKGELLQRLIGSGLATSSATGAGLSRLTEGRQRSFLGLNESVARTRIGARLAGSGLVQGAFGRLAQARGSTPQVDRGFMDRLIALAGGGIEQKRGSPLAGIIGTGVGAFLGGPFGASLGGQIGGLFGGGGSLGGASGGFNPFLRSLSSF